MTTQPQLERKVRQLDSDVSALYEICARIELKQGRHDRRFDEMGADLDVLKADMTTLKSNVGTLKSDVDTLKSGVGTLTEQMTEVLGILRDR